MRANTSVSKSQIISLGFSFNFLQLNAASIAFEIGIGSLQFLIIKAMVP